MPPQVLREPLNHVSADWTRCEPLTVLNHREVLCWESGAVTEAEWLTEPVESWRTKRSHRRSKNQCHGNPKLWASWSYYKAVAKIGLWRKGTRCRISLINVVKALVYSGEKICSNSVKTNVKSFNVFFSPNYLTVSLKPLEILLPVKCTWMRLYLIIRLRG